MGENPSLKLHMFRTESKYVVNAMLPLCVMKLI